MKRQMRALVMIAVAVVWMTSSWVFLNSISAGAADTSASAEMGKAKGHEGGQCHHHWKGHGHHRHHGHYALFWKKLNLTDDQKSKIRSIRDEARPKIKQLFGQLKAGREQLNALVKSGPFDEAKVRAIAKQQADIIANLIVEKQRMRSSMYGVLTPEQKAKAEELHKAWKLLHGGEHGHKGHMEHKGQTEQK